MTAIEADQRPPGFRCSTAARDRHDQRIGTAPPQNRWFLIEQPTGWGATAWAGLKVESAVKETLMAILNHANARVMLIRRPGRETDTIGDRRRWCVVDQAAAEPVRWGWADDDAELIRAAELFAGAHPDVCRIADEPTAAGEPRLLLVCTHGRKDVCCATRGRPVAARAAELWPEATWECTHTGGDRFAGNLILLPEGACYGGMDPDDVEPVVRAQIEGRVDASHLRGPCGESSPVQAAVVAAYDRLGPLAWDQVHPLTEQVDEDERWTVLLEIDGVGLVEVTGHHEVTDKNFLTCKADLSKRMYLSIADDLKPLTPHA